MAPVQIQASESNGTGTPDAETDAKRLGFRHIYFDFDRHNLRQKSMNELDRIFNYLSSHPEVRLEVRGHTDSYGGDNYNQILSENRSEAAYNYLVSRGLDESRIMVSGYSERNPIDGNESSTGRQNNRRVEFVMINNGRIIAESLP